MKKITIYDIAEKLDVSPASVTRALNNLPKVGPEKRELIIKTAEEMGYTPNRAAITLSRKQICVESVIFGAIPEFYGDIIDGINAAYDELKDFNLQVNLHVMDKNVHDESVLCELLDSFKPRETNAVLIYSVSDTEEIAQSLDRLICSGVHVMVINSDISIANPHYSVYPDGKTAGRMAAEVLDWVSARKNMYFFMGDKATGILRHNNFGFLKEAEERNLNIVGRFHDNGNAENAIHNFEKFIAQNPNIIDGIYINSAVSNDICKGFYHKGLLDKFKIVASDLGKDIVEYIGMGKMPATIFQNPFKQGSESLQRMYVIITGYKDIESTKLVSPIIISKSNVGFYAQFV